MKIKSLIFKLKKKFNPLATILIFLYYDVIFYFTKRNLLGNTEKLLNLLKVIGQRTNKSF